MSYHDHLTGLYNRRFYEEELRRLDTERNLPLTLILGDVNGLKLVNDSFGHVLGDELLKKTAEVIKKCCRADAYDAMSSVRSYKRALSEAETIEEIRRCADTQFDPTIAKIFIEKVLEKTWIS